MIDPGITEKFLTAEFTKVFQTYRTVGLVDLTNLPDQPQFHQTDTI